MSATPPPTVAWESPELEAGPASGVEFAPHGGRLVAYILDSIIVSIAVGIPLIIGFVLLGSGATIEGDQVTAIDSGATAGFSLLFVLAGVIGLLYFPFFWARGGQTPGMAQMKIKIVRDADGGPVTAGAAILRIIGLWVGLSVLYIGVIWIFIDKRKRGWQDLIGGTVVVDLPPTVYTS